ncbi:MAG: hypothetical protein KGI24_04140 [Candidatus Omnitrophica bacterium]|nr:hypothetical protein [Candidatus Omnitrophota bacterium]MDE2214407.1 hypothetical protein [Candidatus Omnitrophota bacterium]
MKLKILLLLVLGISAATVCFAQSRDPSMGSESSSVGVWPSVDSPDSISPGYDSSDHGNVS